MTKHPDLYSNVHKGIRNALFTACAALGRASGDRTREAEAKTALAGALRFVAHHGENEDVLLLPLLRERAPTVFAAMTKDHADLDTERERLGAIESIDALYLAACAFTARYLAHLDAEERELDAQIRAVLTVEELATFGRMSVQRTAPADQRMMLGWMIPAMTPSDASELLGRLPPALADELRGALP
jgi:hypothetical protein